MQQALAAMQGRPKPSLPMPSKRTSVMARSPDRERRDSGESSSDEDSVVTEESPSAGGPTGKILCISRAKQDELSHFLCITLLNDEGRKVFCKLNCGKQTYFLVTSSKVKMLLILK